MWLRLGWVGCFPPTSVSKIPSLAEFCDDMKTSHSYGASAETKPYSSLSRAKSPPAATLSSCASRLRVTSSWGDIRHFAHN